MFPEGGEIDLDKLKAKRAIVATGKLRSLPLKVPHGCIHRFTLLFFCLNNYGLGYRQ